MVFHHLDPFRHLSKDSVVIAHLLFPGSLPPTVQWVLEINITGLIRRNPFSSPEPCSSPEIVIPINWPKSKFFAELFK